MKKALIVGCGVIGLSCGIELINAGYKVDIVTRDVPPNTTSNWAAALWYPYKAYPYDRVLGWGASTFRRFQTLIKEPNAGVFNAPMIELLSDKVGDPWWVDAVDEFRHAETDEVPEGYGHAFLITVPIFDTGIYLEYLVAQYKQLGGTITIQDVASLDSLAEDNRLIINCTGLGARELVGDTGLYPIRGQIAKVKADGVKLGVLDDTDHAQPLYIIPRTHDVVLGGTALQGNWDETPDPETAELILRETLRLDPALEGAELIQHGVGLRPGRDEVRLEAEQLTDDCTVIHCYGHGGAGFTLSWGCAEEVVELAEKHSVQG